VDGGNWCGLRNAAMVSGIESNLDWSIVVDGMLWVNFRVSMAGAR